MLDVYHGDNNTSTSTSTITITNSSNIINSLTLAILDRQEIREKSFLVLLVQDIHVAAFVGRFYHDASTILQPTNMYGSSQITISEAITRSIDIRPVSTPS